MKKSTAYTIISSLAALFLGSFTTADALPASTYAENSVLSEGTWIKIAVTQTGLHGIPAATLRQWGFSDPTHVRIYGYGGGRIPDRLDTETYIDDLPLVQTATTPSGTLVFYATGPCSVSDPDADGFISHRLNPWDTQGYYYLTDSDASPREIPTEGTSGGSDAATTYAAYVWHETDLVSPGESGHLLVGEDFRYTTRQSFSLDMPGRVEGTPVNIATRFFTYVTSGTPTLSVSANNSRIGSANRLPVTTTSTYGDTCLIRSAATGISGTRLTVGLDFSSTGLTQRANLDNIGVTYTRSLALPAAGALNFATDSPTVTLSSANASTTVWDVTDALDIKRINHSGGTWTTPYTGMRRYAAFNENAALPQPEFAGRVSNQNIHAQPVPDMIIVTSGSMRAQSERIADLHRNSADSMRVLVVNKDHVWNEFGSGMPDINAVRRMLKMFYDRGTSADGHKLRFALMMGRPFYDHRHLTEFMTTGGYDNMPIWQSDSGSSENHSYSSDDILAMLEDGSGVTTSSDSLCISVGRISVRTPEEARVYVDKLASYHSRLPQGDWKNKIVILADDQDNGVHLEQAESMLDHVAVAPDGPNVMFNKVYVDAYEKVNGVTEGARTQMYKWLNEGAMWWVYIGHASIDNWTTEGMLNRNDLVNNLYFRRPPILYAATCSFQRWDGSMDSGSEMMVNNPSGGVIASICPVRPVYISPNGLFSRRIGIMMLQRDENGRFLPIGEIVRRAKNMGSSDSNKLRFVINGDPAMRVPMPENKIVLESIGDDQVSAENQPTVMAHQRPVFSGYVTDWEGNLLTDFNGTLHLTIFDAEESVTTLGRGDKSDPGKESVFERQGTKLYAGRDKIVNGRFSISVAMPSEIAWNYRNAAVSMYAVADDGNAEAMGCNRDFFVYGYDDSVPDDNNGPVIEALYLNHESFADGDVVNESPMMFASVSDDVGINLSTAGIGHTLLMRIDDTDGFTDVSDFYTPSSDGTPSGTVAYPINGLAPGNHTLTFRVWDTSNNFAQSTIGFYVQPGLAPRILDVYTDTNPAYTQANFYVRHNRPDATVTITVEVFDMLGRPVWSSSATGRSDMFVSTPLSWDLTDNSGRRVNRGIYIYRATVSTDGEHEASEAKRIAVAAE